MRHFFGFVCLLLTLWAFPAFAERIEGIRVDGTQRIDQHTILSYLDIKVGDNVSQMDLDKALKRLYRVGFFADVSLRMERGILNVSIAENPVINEIIFEGNKKFKNDQLFTEIQLRPRVVFTRTKVRADVERLLSIYRISGRFSATIDPKIEKLEQNRVNLIFEIHEGPETRIQSISFIGNKYFDNSHLSKVISSREKRWYRFLSSDDKYDPERLAFDQELLRRYYLDHGYADFRIVSAVAELSPDHKSFFLTFNVDEGERYAVGSVDIFSQVEDMNVDLLEGILSIKTGEWYNAGSVEEMVIELTNEVGNQQYAFVDIQPQVQRNRESKTVDIRFTIHESPRVFVEEINIKGNVRTMDKVIRREMLLVEGDPYNRAKLKKSEQNIKNIGFFEETKVEIKEGSAPDKSVIEVDVTEQSTGELSIGAGFSTADGPLADFRIRERNLLGKGQELALTTTLSGLRTEFDLSFTEPYFMNRDLRTGFDLFHITRDLQDESSFDQRQTGVRLNVGYPLAQDWRQNLRYNLVRNDITDIQAGASFFVQQQEGERITSSVGQTLTYDTRDSRLDPTEGTIFRFETDLAGIGGNAKYVRFKLGGTYYYPIKPQWILSLLGEGGYIFGYSDSDVKINERFFLGGSTLRGFERSGIGPRDLVSEDALGGNRFVRGSVELGFPSGLPEELGVRGHIFSDFGTIGDVDETGASIADDETLRLSVGGGISWRSPMGPIRIDLATPVIEESFDIDEVFRFSFGTSF